MINRSLLNLGLFSHLKHVLHFHVCQFCIRQFYARPLYVLPICLNLSSIFISVNFSPSPQHHC